MAVIPVREGVKALSEGLPAPTLTRHSWRGKGRAWVEVRGLDGPDGAELGRLVVDTVRARSGVKSVSVNRPLSRIVVTLNHDQISLRDLCRDVDEAEKRWRASSSVDPRRSDTRPKPLPGDGLLLATNALGVGATAVGVSAAVAGRMLRWPRLFSGVEAMVVAVDYQPRLRRLLEDRIGHSATDAALSVAMVTAHVLELSPASLAVDLAMETLKAAEYQAEAQAWRRHEPALARHAEHPEVHPPSRPVPPPEGPVEQHARRSAWVQVLGTAAAGAFTRNPEMAATATLVTTPKATRTTRESFAAALGQGLAERHAVLALHPEKLRWLDRVDALLVDPRVLCTNTLRVVRVRGADEDELSPAWNRAQLLLEKKGLRVGWHPVPGLSGKGSARRRSADRPDARPARLGGAGRGASGRPGIDLRRRRRSRRIAARFRRAEAIAEGIHRHCAHRGADRSAAIGPHRRGRVFGCCTSTFVGRCRAGRDAQFRRGAAALDGRSDPERPRRRVAAAARRSGGQIGEPTWDRDRNRRDGIGRAADGARRARARAGPGDDRRGRRSAVGLSDGPPGAAHTGPAAGADPRVARHVDRAGPQDVAATGRRADGGAAARHRHPGNGNRPPRCRADRAPAAGGVAIR